METNNNKIDTFTETFLVDAQEAGRLLSVSRTQFLSLDKSGRLGPVSVNLGYGAKRQCRRWRINELREWVEHGCTPRPEWLKRNTEV